MNSIKRTQNNFTAGVLSPGVQARDDLAKYNSGCKTIINGIVQYQGGVKKRPGFIRISYTYGNDFVFIPFMYSVDQTYAILLHGGPDENMVLEVYSKGGRIHDGSAFYELVTPYANGTDVLKLRYTQSADVLFLAHPDYPPYRLERHGETDWRFVEMTFAPSVAAPTGVTTVISGFGEEGVPVDVKYEITAVDRFGEESPVSDPVSARIRSFWKAGAIIMVSWDSVEGVDRYQVYKNDSGFYAWVGSVENTPGGDGKVTFTDNNIKSDTTRCPKQFRNPFNGPGNYPGAVGLYQQRLVFGRTDCEPQTIWASEVGDYGSMAVSNPIRKDNAITATLDSRQMNEIKHFIPLRDMLVLTSGAEFKMESGETSGAITPTSVKFPIQSYWGSSDATPVVVGTSVIMVQNGGKVLRDVHYSFAEDGYSGMDLCVLVEHLFDSPIKCMTYQQDPDSVIWIVLESGRLLALTYVREQEVWAWSEMNIPKSRVEAVTTIREGSRDRLYAVLSNADTQNTVECLGYYEYGTDVSDCVFMDHAERYVYENGSDVIHRAVVTYSGNVYKFDVFADGSYLGRFKAKDDGTTIHLDRKVYKAVVGNLYDFEMETLDPELQNQYGDGSGLKKNVVRTSITVRDTVGLEMGPDRDHLVEVKFPMQKKWDEPAQPYTGSLDVSVPGLHRDSASMVFRQRNPYPLTIQSFTEWVSIGD